METKTIGIFACRIPNLKPWDPDTIQTGITGSEEAVIYVSEKLAKLGVRVFVYGDPPAGSKHSLPEANPRYISLQGGYDGPLDVAISWRMPHIGPFLKQRAKKVFFWPEDICNIRLEKECIDALDGVLWISEWQRQQWVSINPELGVFRAIFGNAINPEEFHPVKERANPYSCIYGSNYARGLEVLIDLWPAVKEEFPKASLDIYYGWQHWGCLSPEKEAAMRKILPTLPDVHEHGLVGHAELNRAYETASFWVYPCIMSETFCTTALRAQMGGAIPVILVGSALTETVRHGFRTYLYEDYLPKLLKALGEAERITLEDRSKMRQFILEKYTWEKIAAGWKQLFDGWTAMIP